MKKLLLVSAAIALGTTGFAQNRGPVTASDKTVSLQLPAFNMTNVLGKSTGDGDTFATSHILTGDTVTFYYGDSSPYDSGFVTGTNAYGDKGFAERYDYYSPDSSIKIAGVIARFGGSWLPTSNKSINFRVWTAGPMTNVTGRPNLFLSGFPNAILATEQVNITQLRMGVAAAPDTQKLHWFTTPTGFLNDTFFVGYDINYTFANLAGDTIALYSDQDGERNDNLYYVVGADTIITTRNATQYSDNSWHDNATDNYQLFHNLEIFPVYIVKYTTSVNGLSKNNFTLYGNYPNPATNSTNVQYAVKNTTEVTIDVMDVTGRTISTSNEGRVAAGEHTATINTSSLPAGTYVYLIRTAEGNGMAAQFTVTK